MPLCRVTAIVACCWTLKVTLAATEWFIPNASSLVFHQSTCCWTFSDTWSNWMVYPQFGFFCVSSEHLLLNISSHVGSNGMVYPQISYFMFLQSICRWIFKSHRKQLNSLSPVRVVNSKKFPLLSTVELHYSRKNGRRKSFYYIGFFYYFGFLCCSRKLTMWRRRGILEQCISVLKNCSHIVRNWRAWKNSRFVPAVWGV